METYRLTKSEIKKSKREGEILFSLLCSILIPVTVFAFLYFVVEEKIDGSLLPQYTSSISTTFLPIIAVVITAAKFSGEFEENTIKVLLTKPVTRENILISKFLFISIVLGILLLIIEITSFLLGFCWGYQNPKEVLLKSLSFVGVELLVLLVLVSFTLFLGLFFSKTSTILISLVSFHFSSIINAFGLETYFVKHHMNFLQETVIRSFAFGSLEPSIIQKSIGIVAIYILSFLLISTFLFERRDVV